MVGPEDPAPPPGDILEDRHCLGEIVPSGGRAVEAHGLRIDSLHGKEQTILVSQRDPGARKDFTK